MNITSLVSCCAIAAAAADIDNPRNFLVVAGDSSQTIVDVAAWKPDRTDFVKCINALPEDGITNWSGTRLALITNVPGETGHAIHVREQGSDPKGHSCTKPYRALELIGWLGTQNKVVIRDRDEMAGHMLRVVDVPLAAEAPRVTDITPEPGVYKLAVVSGPTGGAGEGVVAYFRVKGNERGDVIVWRAHASTVIAHDVEPSSICLSPDGKRLAVAERGKVSVVDAHPPYARTTIQLPPGCRDEPAWVSSMAWCPDGSSIALLPAWPRPDHAPNNPRVWSLDLDTATCTVLVNLTYPAQHVRWIEGDSCDLSLDEAAARATAPVSGQRP